MTYIIYIVYIYTYTYIYIHIYRVQIGVGPCRACVWPRVCFSWRWVPEYCSQMSSITSRQITWQISHHWKIEKGWWKRGNNKHQTAGILDSLLQNQDMWGGLAIPNRLYNILSLVARRDVFFCKDIPLYWYNSVNTRTKTSMVDNEQQAMMKVFGPSSNVWTFAGANIQLLGPIIWNHSHIIT